MTHPALWAAPKDAMSLPMLLILLLVLLLENGCTPRAGQFVCVQALIGAHPLSTAGEPLSPFI